ncbi:hypothetical protein HYDPIDRAFT_167590 [Hydnomerulius pinastri MD-312]|uniref:Yeast cell wall synthesis Kre9/Knh1-like N-terminal domain-containing protein n=1 Tax=Hydnomerulius pinastri MD-312 TaxID=994086 RepID=A0A0C9VGR9_9AGAM|nr:hypothetical protein HYDPIDRAFT_167590 [Hydnomerulius pinastri MD-312]
MHAFQTLVSLALLARVALVQGSVYVTNPVQPTVCHGGQSCSVEWVDNGESPLLSTIGECEVGLYTGELELAQSLPSVNVGTTSSFSFTPNPSVGPNGQYYLVFTADSISYMGFSGSFTLDGMTGTTVGGGAGGSSASAPTTTATGGSSTSAGGSSTGTGTGTTPTGTGASTPGSESTGASTPATGTGAPTVSTPATGTVPTTSSPTATAPVLTTSGGTTFTVSTPSSSISASASATPTNAAVRVGSSSSLGAALVLALGGAFLL